ncbi:hypothetical protein HMPREF1982_01208 [Clostridiales bacterium oral taxon 876 str. F0540]|nr:hypothetical protein HMPREF1982_01208 [Clostridiales bacterium oral taxon 876 str. F0540]
MYINDYSMFANLYNWITDSCCRTPIKVDEKSDFFSSSQVSNYKDEFYINSINKLVGYNYLYNYIYNLQMYIKKFDGSFSFSNYNNIYELSSYSESIEDIDLLVFIDWFLEEGIVKIVDFINCLELSSYKDEDMYNIMRYYNYIIDNSIKNESDTILTFLTEGSNEIFNKLNKYMVKSVTFSDVMDSMNKDISVTVGKDFILSTAVSPQGITFKNSFDVLMSACEMQTSFFIKWRDINEVGQKTLS